MARSFPCRLGLRELTGDKAVDRTNIEAAPREDPFGDTSSSSLDEDDLAGEMRNVIGDFTVVSVLSDVRGAIPGGGGGRSFGNMLLATSKAGGMVKVAMDEA